MLAFHVQHKIGGEERLVVVGSHELLGAWNPHRGVALRGPRFLPDLYEVEIELSARDAAALEYKYVVLRGGDVIWEDGDNRRVHVENSSAVHTFDAFNQRHPPRVVDPGSVVIDAATSPLAASHLRIMTFNLRYDNPSDKKDAWPHRVVALASSIIHHRPHILGCQEALVSQLFELVSYLGPYGYNFYGVGRTDGRYDGEFNPVFYDSSRMEATGLARTFWLSQTPQVPSRHRTASLPRVLTCLGLVTRDTQQPVLVMNTHFDHVSETARNTAAEIVAQCYNDIREEIDSAAHVFIMGDLNTEPASQCYDTMANHWKDCRSVAGSGSHPGTRSFQGWHETEAQAILIDYIFTRHDDSSLIIQYAVLNDLKRDGRRLSDHKALLVDIEIG